MENSAQLPRVPTCLPPLGTAFAGFANAVDDSVWCIWSKPPKRFKFRSDRDAEADRELRLPEQLDCDGERSLTLPALCRTLFLWSFRCRRLLLRNRGLCLRRGC
mmetsp:Transcript_13104/g.37393  ORF Transcript_13104/g.37393 Transcript_13104/m.37393 type:complete len:104 (+) Transcript_13104:384-695(+)